LYFKQAALATNLERLGGHEFEDLVEQLLLKMGFTTEGRKPSADGGVDIVAISSLPLVSGRYIVQCKRYDHPVSSPIIRDLYGVVMSERANKGILITTSSFTSDAVEFAHEKPIELIDGNKLIDMLEKYSLVAGQATGLSQSQTTGMLLRNELAGLANKLDRELALDESRLVLNMKSFGDETKMSTYTTLQDWTAEIGQRLNEEGNGIRMVSDHLLRFQNSSSADLGDARRLRLQFEELFHHMLSLYDEVRKANVPRAASNYKTTLLEMFLNDIRHYIEFLRSVESALDNQTPLPSYQPISNRGSGLGQAKEELYAGIRQVFRGRGHGHRLGKTKDGRWVCMTCKLGYPSKEEAIAHIKG
jgi:hypothetical protein